MGICFHRSYNGRIASIPYNAWFYIVFIIYIIITHLVGTRIARAQLTWGAFGLNADDGTQKTQDVLTGQIPDHKKLD